MTMMLALSFLSTRVAVGFAQETKTKTQKKKTTKKKAEKKTTEKK